MSQAQFTLPLITVIPGQLITAALWNNEWNNIDINLNPSGIGGYSDTDTQMQIQTAPYPGSVTSHATSEAGEWERVRYQISAILGGTTPPFWYAKPPIDLTTLSASIIPVGGIFDYPSATAPSNNYHLADGTAINRVLYPTLFTLIGTTFGIGDGTTTFNLPNLTDKMSIGAGNLYALAATGGATTQTPVDSGHTHGDAHTHTMANHTHSTPNHQHNLAHTSEVVTSGNSTVDGNLTSFSSSGGNRGLASVPSSGGEIKQFTAFGSSSSNIWDHIQNCTENSGSGTSGGPNTNTTDSQSTSTTGSGTANMQPVSILPPYMGLYKMMRVL